MDYEGDIDSYKTLLAVAPSSSELVERWDKKCEKELKAVSELHKSYADNVPPKFLKGQKSLEYLGNTGGGYSYVKIIVTIEQIKQWDK